LSQGTIVGERYRIVAPLARGGFGAVYVAEQLTTERRVALKVLARYAEQISVDRLLAEARVTTRIVSDHIVQVIDAGVDRVSGDVFVVMELLRGVTLDEHLMAHGALPAAEVAEYLRQVGVGLDKAHGHLDRNGRLTPIVHRDLKPSNIFLSTRDDGKPLLKILDFGAAKVLSQSTKASGLIHGTPQFMASEQALGDPSSVATDIWAFGLIAFNLLTGSPYWLTVHKDGTQAQLFAEILTLRLAPPRQRARELGLSVPLPPAFDRWFLRCVNRDPAQRFASAGLAAGELSRLLGVPASESSEPLRRSPSALAAEAARASADGSDPQQLETVAALSRAPPLLRPGRTLASLAMLGFALAGATAIALWKRAPRPSPASSSTALSAAPSSADAAALPTHAPAPAPSPSAAPSSVPPLSVAPPRPLVPEPTSSSRAPSTIKRPPSPTRLSTPRKTSGSSRDPYEQR
jgi:eukaryotic-like serine/threonine-protein kinase